MEEQALLNKLGSWVSEAAANKTALVYYVGVDIGATRTRVGLRRHGDPSVLIIRKVSNSVLPCCDIGSSMLIEYHLFFKELEMLLL